MQDWFKNLSTKFTGGAKKTEQPLLTTVATQYEVNLVPEVKLQMIKAQKVRNLVLFVCIVVSAISVGVVLILFGIKSGQDIAMANQDKKLDKLSSKLMDYSELGDLVTIQRQLEKLTQLSADKPILSRVFGAMAVMLPAGGDIVQLSELRADMESNMLRIDAQADARTAPLIDYRVLESFKKGVALTKYDYGRYVDANDVEIPTWCIDDTDAEGNAYREGENYYAWWDLTKAGCKGVAKGTSVKDDSDVFFYDSKSEVERAEEEVALSDLQADEDIDVKIAEDGSVSISGTEVDVRQEGDHTGYYRDVAKRVKIWRTPQFDDWHKSGYMELNGTISGIQHFESECIQYTGAMQGGSNIAKWTSTNDCMLVPDGLTVSSSANGRDDGDNLVLKFSASLEIASDFFLFKNKHMMAIGPMGQNVTDSYVQLGGMFTQEARECDKNDSECLTNSGNSGGTSNDSAGDEKEDTGGGSENDENKDSVEGEQ